MECCGRGFEGGGGGCVAAERLAAALARKRSIGAVQDGAGAAAASSQGIGGIGGELVAGFAAVPKTSAQLRPGPGDVGAPGSVSPWPPPSAKESRRVGVCAIDASAFLSEFQRWRRARAIRSRRLQLCLWAVRARTSNACVQGY
mmetsp:Transcript_13804/g.36675  ORF Transcript_13804/g.36675 Transcript_13804/m.36675 type:complete len:144 (-) Transcript_13804:83-514(-)